MPKIMEDGKRGMLLMTAANQEALRAGDREVDVEHLLLALWLSDSNIGRSLQGVATLEQARAAVREVDRTDLAGIGIVDTDDLSPQPPRAQAQSLDWTSRAADALRPTFSGAGEDAVLDILLADPDGTPARALRALGWTGEHADPAQPAVDALDEGAADGWQASVRAVVPVPIDALWELLADPGRRPDWDAEVAAVEVRDPQTSVGTGAMTVDHPLLSRVFGFGDLTTYRITEIDPGDMIEWQATTPGRERGLRARTPQEELMRVELAEAGPDQTNVTVRVWRSPGSPARRRVLSGLAESTARTRAELVLQAIAQAG